MRVLVLAATLAAVCSLTLGALVNEDVSRTIDMTSHLTNVVTEITVKNTGAAVSEYKLAEDFGVDGTLSYFSAQVCMLQAHMSCQQNKAKESAHQPAHLTCLRALAARGRGG